jgi:hypothetical protein
MTILRHTGGNIGGMHPVQYIFKEDISAFNISIFSLTGSLTLKTGKSWNYLYGSPESIQIEGKEEATAAGTKYVYQLKMLIPKDRPDVELVLRNLNNRHLIINAIDKNGVSRYFGTPQSPMKKSGKLLKPANIEGYNGWEVVFIGEFDHPASYSAIAGFPLDPPE